MILTDSTAARVQGSTVTGIISVSSTFYQFMCYSAITILQAIGGTIGLVKNGIQTLTLEGFVNYTGKTQIKAGSLIIASGSLIGIISGEGSLTKISSGILSLIGGAGNQYTGGTFFNQGRLSFNSGSAFGTGLFTSQGGTDILTGSAAVIPNNFLINSGTLGLTTLGANTVVITGDISGVGSVNKSGNGIYDLKGNLSYTGSTNITTGTIRAYKTVGVSKATANFTTATTLTITFDVPPAEGTQTYTFFQGSTRSYTTINLVNAPGRTGAFNSTTSTLTIT